MIANAIPEATRARRRIMPTPSEVTGVVGERLHLAILAELDDDGQRSLRRRRGASVSCDANDEHRAIGAAVGIRRLGGGFVVDPRLMAGAVPGDDVRGAE